MSNSHVDARARRVRSEVCKEVPREVDDSDLEPLPENSFGEYGDFQLVGHGKVTNGYCGKFRKLYGCSRLDLHNLRTLDGERFKGKVYFKPTFYSCDKPSCPKCYRYGWSVREARSIEGRLAEASKRFGQVEHISCSVPHKDYGLSFEAMRKKAVEVLRARGVVGGALIFHAFRYDLHKYWYFSPHFHVLGFVLGGYGRCRNCERKWNCLAGCGGFDDRNYQNFLKDGWHLKILGERESVYHTAWYQLHHSSIKKGVRRFRVVSWFGVASYRKLKVTVEYRKSICPICLHDLVEHLYFGNNPDVLAVFRSDRGSCGKRNGCADLVEDGRVVWFEKVKPKYW